MTENIGEKGRCWTPRQDTEQPAVAFEELRFIWLQPWCDYCEEHYRSDEGRTWCQDDVWGQCDECDAKAVRYELSPQPERSPVETPPSNTDETQNNGGAQPGSDR